jgi:hypothetical protein
MAAPRARTGSIPHSSTNFYVFIASLESEKSAPLSVLFSGFTPERSLTM